MCQTNPQAAVLPRLKNLNPRAAPAKKIKKMKNSKERLLTLSSVRALTSLGMMFLVLKALKRALKKP